MTDERPAQSVNREPWLEQARVSGVHNMAEQILAWLPDHDREVAERATRELLAEIERLKQQLRESEAGADALDKKLESLAPHGTCACSFDSPDDLCAHHSPQLIAAQAAIKREARNMLAMACALFCGRGTSGLVFPPTPSGKNRMLRECWTHPVGAGFGGRVKCLVSDLRRAYAAREAEREKGGQHGATEG